MASKFAVAVALLLFALPAEAGPLSAIKDFAKRQVTEHPVRTRIVTSVPVHLALLHGVSVCAADGRQENCLCGYGPRTACAGTIIGLDVVGQIVGYKITGKTGDAISYGGTGLELGFAIQQWNGGKNKPVEDHDEKSTSDFRKYLRPAGVRR